MRPSVRLSQWPEATLTRSGGTHIWNPFSSSTVCDLGYSYYTPSQKKLGDLISYNQNLVSGYYLEVVEPWKWSFGERKIQAEITDVYLLVYDSLNSRWSWKLKMPLKMKLEVMLTITHDVCPKFVACSVVECVVLVRTRWCVGAPVRATEWNFVL